MNQVFQSQHVLLGEHLTAMGSNQNWHDVFLLVTRSLVRPDQIYIRFSVRALSLAHSLTII